jgi:hypothetical protein
MQSEAEMESKTLVRAKRTVRIKLLPMICYLAFILAALLYAYVRVVYGMGGLTLGLMIYSYIVLFVEMLGALNMLFYGCWLFAKPVNDDVFPPPDKLVRALPSHFPPLHRLQQTALFVRRKPIKLNLIQAVLCASCVSAFV